MAPVDALRGLSEMSQQQKDRIEFISSTGRPLGHITKLTLLCDALKELLQADQKRWEPNQDLSGGPDSLIEEFLAGIDDYYNYDPTPQFLYDDTGGEPAKSADEMWMEAFIQKQELHS